MLMEQFLQFSASGVTYWPVSISGPPTAYHDGKVDQTGAVPGSSSISGTNEGRSYPKVEGTPARDSDSPGRRHVDGKSSGTGQTLNEHYLVKRSDHDEAR